jgi:hypothetical protein
MVNITKKAINSTIVVCSYSGAVKQSFIKDWSATWVYSQNGDYSNTPKHRMICLLYEKRFFNKKIRMNLSTQNVLKKKPMDTKYATRQCNY